jgi:hypothetical protein
MTACPNWTCVNCGDSHGHEFDTCWKCGTECSGAANSDFEISEPVEAVDQAPDPEVGVTESPKLPNFTYFCIPVCIVLFLIEALLSVSQLNANPAGNVFWSPTSIIVGVFSTVLVGLPVFFTLCGEIFTIVIRPQEAQDWTTMMRRFLGMIELPASIRLSCPWFVPTYYGSILVVAIAPIVLAVIRLFVVG